MILQVAEREEKHVMIETTLGDLIAAICDAASEANIDDTEILELTDIALYDLLNKYRA